MDKIICLGKNYAEHAAEMGGPMPEKPVIFLKPPSVLHVVQEHGHAEVVIPPGDSTLHHECEVVLRIDKGGYRMDLREAEKAIGAVTLGLDMTLRDVQSRLKKNGHPWEISKVFPDSAIIGPWVRVSEFPDWKEHKFVFALEDEIRQDGFVSQMNLSPAECVAWVSEHIPLCPGDIVFTGTPKGVGPVVAGQKGTLSWGNIRFSVHWAPFPNL